MTPVWKVRTEALLPLDFETIYSESIYVVGKDDYDALKFQLDDLKASMHSWEVHKEIEILARSDRQWNELLAERDELRDKVYQSTRRIVELEYERDRFRTALNRLKEICNESAASGTDWAPEFDEVEAIATGEISVVPP